MTDDAIDAVAKAMLQSTIRTHSQGYQARWNYECDYWRNLAKIAIEKYRLCLLLNGELQCDD